MNPLFLKKPAEAPEWQVSEWIGTDQEPSLADLRGKVVVLHAFQMLCPGCILHGVPQTTKIHAFVDPVDVAVIGLHSVFENHHAMTPDSLRVFLSEFRVSFPVAVDRHQGLEPLPLTMKAYGMRGTPSLLLIDRAGRLRAHIFGKVEDLALGAAIQQLTDESYPNQEPI